MHDIDRTQAEYAYDMEGFDPNAMEINESEMVFDEATEMELAGQFLEVVDDAELDQFLGNLFKKAGRAIGRFVRTPTGRSLGGILKGVAKTALPVVGGALGTAIAPGIGTALGGALGQAAGSMFGLELEGLSPEDQEFEVARRFVKLAGEAVKNATSMAPGIDPRQAANAAVKAAAQKFAPGVLAQLGGVSNIPRLATAGMSPNTGRWIRRGRKIVLLGV